MLSGVLEFMKNWRDVVEAPLECFVSAGPCIDCLGVCRAECAASQIDAGHLQGERRAFMNALEEALVYSRGQYSPTPCPCSYQVFCLRLVLAPLTITSSQTEHKHI